MKLFSICTALCLMSLVSYSQDKTTSTNSTTSTKAKTKVVNGDAMVKDDSNPNPSGVSSKRTSTPVNNIVRTREMLDRKKTAPLLSDPQERL